MADLSIIQTVAKQRGMKMSELAEKTNMTQQALFQIIRNNSTKVSTLENIADVLGVSPAIFFGEQSRKESEDIALLRAKITYLELMNKSYEAQIEALKQANDVLKEVFNKHN